MDDIGAVRDDKASATCTSSPTSSSQEGCHPLFQSLGQRLSPQEPPLTMWG